MARGIVPIEELGGPLLTQEQGRIRIGAKTAKGFPTSLETFRFTSPYQDAIEQVAKVYGGTPEEWHEDRATKKDQWQVISQAAEIRVWLGQGMLTQNYELWTGSERVRSCDGRTCSVPQRNEDGIDYIDTPCICANGDVECKPVTRMLVILPEIRFAGGWRIETRSWNAAREMPGMEQMIASLQHHQIAQGSLVIAEGKTVAGGKTKRFRFPRLVIDATPEEMLSGAASIRALPAASVNTPPAELVERTWDPEDERPFTEVIDAELVEESAEEATSWRTQREAYEDAGLQPREIEKREDGRWHRKP